MAAVAREIAPEDRLLTSREVAALFRVSTRTPGAWARAGRITPIRVGAGGDYRYRETEIHALLNGWGSEVMTPAVATDYDRAAIAEMKGETR